MVVTKKGPLLLTLARWSSIMMWLWIFSLKYPMAGAAAKVLSLEDMHLKRDKNEFPVEVLKQSSSATAGFQGVIEGYELSHLQPFDNLFSDRYYASSSDKTQLTDARTNEVLNVPIYRAMFDDGSVLFAEKDEHGNIVYVELRRSRGNPDIFLIPSASSEVSDDEEDQQMEDSEFVAFTEDDVDYEELQSQFHYAESSTPEDSDRRLRKSKSKEEELVPSHDYRNGREAFAVSSSFSSTSIASATTTGCQSFRVVNLAIVFDAEFCSMYGGFEAARRRIMTIVASASFHYERDMCVQLRLTDIFTPETTCSEGNSYFEQYERDFPCGGNASFLSRFSSYMEKYRTSFKFDEDATIQMFTGVQPPGGTIGCAYVGSFCNKAYTYGIEYMSFATNPHSQGVVLAHEIGHILNAAHLRTDSFSHIMEPNINNAADGFSVVSINSILSFLNSNDITCDSFSSRIVNPVPTTPPSPRPTPLPTPMPTPIPTPQPTPVSTTGRCNIFQDVFRAPKCIFTSNEDGYACFDASSVLDATTEGGCTFPVPRTRILRCGGPLQPGSSVAPDTFRARSCSASCVVVSNNLCFRVDGQERVYSITFDAYADFDVFQTFQTDVFVRDDDGSATCDVAATKCVS